MSMLVSARSWHRAGWKLFWRLRSRPGHEKSRTDCADILIAVPASPFGRRLIRRPSAASDDCAHPRARSGPVGAQLFLAVAGVSRDDQQIAHHRLACGSYFYSATRFCASNSASSTNRSLLCRLASVKSSRFTHSAISLQRAVTYFFKS
jgi:hypothetical protein